MECANVCMCVMVLKVSKKKETTCIKRAAPYNLN